MTRVKAAIWCVVTALPLTGVAEARFLDGSDLLDACHRLPYMAKDYVIGETWQLDEFMAENGVKLYCAPSDLTGEQKADIVCRYMKATPNARNLSMKVAVSTAMAAAYPCASE